MTRRRVRYVTTEPGAVARFEDAHHEANVYARTIAELLADGEQVAPWLVTEYRSARVAVEYARARLPKGWA